MCLLTFLPAAVMPDPDALLNGTYLNNDGHGFAIVTGAGILTERGMDAPTVIDAFATARRRHPHGPALFHSRLATHGTRNTDNCHPFQIGGDRRTVLAHNGVLPTAVQPRPGDPRSDTRITAEDFLPDFGSLRSRRTRRKLERWMTRHNKMVILTADRRFTQAAYILNESAGIWHGGIWYSNNGYRPLAATRWNAHAWEWLDLDQAGYPVDRCGNCRAALDPLGRHCGWCLDCRELPPDCFCYSPARLDHRPGAAQIR